jgi:hypothetical protein
MQSRIRDPLQQWNRFIMWAKIPTRQVCLVAVPAGLWGRCRVAVDWSWPRAGKLPSGRRDCLLILVNQLQLTSITAAVQVAVEDLKPSSMFGYFASYFYHYHIFLCLQVSKGLKTNAEILLEWPRVEIWGRRPAKRHLGTPLNCWWLALKRMSVWLWLSPDVISGWRPCLATDCLLHGWSINSTYIDQWDTCYYCYPVNRTWSGSLQCVIWRALVQNYWRFKVI